MPAQKAGTRKSSRSSGDEETGVIVEQNPSGVGSHILLDRIVLNNNNNNNNQDMASPDTVLTAVSSDPSASVPSDLELAALQNLQAELDKIQSDPSSSGGVPQVVSNNVASHTSSAGVDGSGVVSAVAAAHGQTVQLLKRPAIGTSAPVLTKVIITTKNLASQQLQTITVPASQSVPMTTLTPKTPTKTVALSSIISPSKTPPAKQTLNKVPISPAKTPGKITMIAKSPQRIAPALGPSNVMLSRTLTTTTAAGNKSQTITMSPSRVVIRQQPSVSVAMATSNPTQTATVVRQVALPSVTAANVKQVQVPGSKFHYVRLVTAPTSQSQPLANKTIAPAQVKSIAPATSIPGQIRLAAVPSATQSISVAGQSTGQRLLLPANAGQIAIRPNTSTNQVGAYSQIRPSATVANLTQLPPGTTILSSGSGHSVPGFALVPAQYIAQLQLNNQQSQASVQTDVVTAAKKESTYVPIMSNDPSVSNSQQQRRNAVNGANLYDAPGGTRPRKPCNCTKSQCLKLYCDCFANGEFCHNCNCNGCFNNLDHEEDRARAIKSCLDRNPHAFHPKIGKAGRGEGERRHQKGCNCKRSNCLKNYCECYEAKIMCSNICKCVGCKNFEESPERKSLMKLADAAEVRALQQTAAKTKLSSQIKDLPSRPLQSTSGERLPYSFVTNEVAEATCACLVAQAEEAEKMGLEEEQVERLVLEEFGRCLKQVIDSANKTKVMLEDSPL